MLKDFLKNLMKKYYLVLFVTNYKCEHYEKEK